jgi:hypothetical protein
MKHSVTLLLVVLVFFSAPSLSQGAKGGIQYTASVGIGAGFPYKPEAFKDHWDPSFGLLLDVGAGKSIVEVSVSLDYNFFLSDTQVPQDANLMALFANLKIKPISKTSVRPYIVVGGGYFRYWIVDLDLYDNALGFGGGAGVELEMNEEQRLFIEVKNLIGRTREPGVNPEKANTEYVPVRVGLTFVF